MTRVERRLAVCAFAASAVAIAVAVVEPRAAASMLGLICVLGVLGLSIRSLDQLARRLPSYAATGRIDQFIPTTRELPQDIDIIRQMIAPLRPSEPIPSAITMRIREIAAPRLAQQHEFQVDDQDSDRRLVEVVSPAMYCILVSSRQPIRMALLPALLDELERL